LYSATAAAVVQSWLHQSCSVYYFASFYVGLRQNVSCSFVPLLVPDRGDASERVHARSRSMPIVIRLYGVVSLVQCRRIYTCCVVCVCRATVRPNDEPCYVDYGGPWPGSERETRAVTSFLLERNESIAAFVTMHSYAQMILTRWAYTNNLYPPEHNETVRRFCCQSVATVATRRRATTSTR